MIGEALSHGLPVIATVNSGAADLLREGETGFIVPIRSPEAITGKLQLLADDPAMLEKFSATADSRDNGTRSWENTGQNLVNALESFTQMPKL